MSIEDNQNSMGLGAKLLTLLVVVIIGMSIALFLSDRITANAARAEEAKATIIQSNNALAIARGQQDVERLQIWLLAILQLSNQFNPILMFSAAAVWSIVLLLAGLLLGQKNRSANPPSIYQPVAREVILGRPSEYSRN